MIGLLRRLFARRRTMTSGTLWESRRHHELQRDGNEDYSATYTFAIELARNGDKRARAFFEGQADDGLSPERDREAEQLLVMEHPKP